MKPKTLEKEKKLKLTVGAIILTPTKSGNCEEEIPNLTVSTLSAERVTDKLPTVNQQVTDNSLPTTHLCDHVLHHISSHG